MAFVEVRGVPLGVGEEFVGDAHVMPLRIAGVAGLTVANYPYQVNMYYRAAGSGPAGRPPPRSRRPPPSRPYTSVVSAAREMTRHGVKRLPVVGDEGLLVGIVSRHDLLKVLARPDV
ncbi:MAG: CBS domain-containing protein, partial [Microbispora sp.]|nr:CBS domain-containing protein [Microbispora sp.]